MKDDLGARAGAAVPKEIFSQVRRIEIRTRRLVAETFGGGYLSVFKGRGMEFADIREYVPGDDVRAIDWNVTARTGRPHLRLYQDERELTVVLACDLSASQLFGTQLKLKVEIAAEIAALLAFSAMHNNDKVGLMLFTDACELYLPPRKGRTHALALIRDLLAFRPRRQGTAIGPCLDTLNRLLKRRGVVFLLSDFQDEGYDRALRLTAARHDLVALALEDPREEDPPEPAAWLELEDPETGLRRLAWGGSRAWREALARRRLERRRALEALLQGAGVDLVALRTDRSYVEPLARLFESRSRRTGHDWQRRR